MLISFSLFTLIRRAGADLDRFDRKMAGCYHHGLSIEDGR